MAAIAFFDVDKTILSINSAALWVRQQFSTGHISRTQGVRVAFWIGLYHLGYVNLEGLIEEAVSTLKGKKERDVIDATLAFYRTDVAHTVRPRARQVIDAHRERGDLAFLLTSSSNYLSAPLSDTLQVDGFLTNRFEVEDGVFTGKAVLPLCFGKGKVAHAETIASKIGVSLSECTFYTDSASDLPMLEAVGTPVVVDGDWRLRRIARKRGWRSESWNDDAVKQLNASAG